MYTKLLEVTLALGLILGAWWLSGVTAVERYKEKQEVAQARSNQALQAKYDKLAGEYEVLRTKRAENARTITKEVERIIEKPSYDGDCLDSDGLQWANAAIRGDISISQSAVQTDSGNSEHK